MKRLLPILGLLILCASITGCLNGLKKYKHDSEAIATVKVNLQGETRAEVDAKLEAAIEEMVKAHKDELQAEDGSTSYSTRIDTTKDVQVGATVGHPPAVYKSCVIRLFKGCIYPRCRKGNYCNGCKKLHRDLGEKIKRR